MTDKAGLKIGEVEARSGVSRGGLCCSEQRGLWPQAARSRSGYRLFDPNGVPTRSPNRVECPRVIERITLIERVRRFGFTLEEIGAPVGAEPTDSDHCSHRWRTRELEDRHRRYAALTPEENAR